MQQEGTEDTSSLLRIFHPRIKLFAVYLACVGFYHQLRLVRSKQRWWTGHVY